MVFLVPTSLFPDYARLVGHVPILATSIVEREKVIIEITLQNIIAAAIVSLAVYAMTAPFKRAIDNALERTET